MGCCQSRDQSSHDIPTTAQRAVEAALPRDASRVVAANQPARAGPNVVTPKPSARPNAPIRPPTPIARSPHKVSNQLPPWTRAHLEQEREAFYDTRVSGDSEVWKGLRAVCEMIRQGEIAEAQGILNAMGLSCPTGRIARDRGKHRERGGVFDERGMLYDLPAWVVIDPLDIVEDGEKEDAITGASDEEQDESGATGSTKEEKGKGKAEDLGEVVSIRARLSNTGTDVKVSIGTKAKVADVVRQIQQQIGGKRVRLMYLGSTLDERSTLEQTGWQQGHVINAMVFEGDESILSKRS